MLWKDKPGIWWEKWVLMITEKETKANPLCYGIFKTVYGFGLLL